MNLRELNKKDYDIFELVFKEFEKYPFYEKWTKKEILEEFKYFLQNGKIFTCDEKGIINILPNYIKSKNLPSIPKSNLYISDVVVLEQYRKQGIGNSLFDFVMDYAKTKYDYIYLRTNLEGSMIEPLAVKRGFEVINNEFNNTFVEDVSFLRQSGEIEKDKRKYLGRLLK